MISIQTPTGKMIITLKDNGHVQVIATGFPQLPFYLWVKINVLTASIQQGINYFNFLVVEGEVSIFIDTTEREANEE